MAADFGQWGAPTTAPAVAETAFQANTTSLWTVGSAGNKDWGLGMMQGTSPSIAALEGGGFVAVFQANTGNLWTGGDGRRQGLGPRHDERHEPERHGAARRRLRDRLPGQHRQPVDRRHRGEHRLEARMMAGTSPSITALADGSFEVAFQANTTNLWTVGGGGNTDWKLGMMAGTSPSITALGYGFQVAFQANTTSLWTVGIGGDKDWALGMMPGTSPSITALAKGGFEWRSRANTTNSGPWATAATRTGASA